MTALSATYLAVALLAVITLNLAVISLVYAWRTSYRWQDVLRLRPIAHAFFIGNIILVVGNLVELVYMTTFFVVRAPYAVNVADAGAPEWMQTMAVGQYYVFYLESMAPAIMLFIICEGIRCLPQHKGIFKYVPPDPRELTDEQIRQIHHEVLIVKDERGIDKEQ